MIDNKKNIDYVEVGVFSTTETVGLLSAYKPDQDVIYLVPKNIKDAAYIDLKYFTVTFIKTVFESRSEEYFFTQNEDDQKEAKQLFESITIELQTDKRCNNSNFIVIDTYRNVPCSYMNTRAAKSCVGSPSPAQYPAKTNLYGCTVQGNVASTTPPKAYVAPIHAPYVAPVHKIIAIGRSEPLPQKEVLEAMFLSIFSGNIVVELPALDETNTVETEDLTVEEDDRFNYMGY